MSSSLALNQAGLEISFHCVSCEEMVSDEIEDAIFDWTQEGVSGGENQAESSVICNCGKEYLVRVTTGPSTKEVRIPAYPWLRVNYRPDREEDEYEAFLENYDSGDAYEVYAKSKSEINEVDLNSPTSGSGNEALSKMVYLQHVVMLEAYLSDRLINLIIDDDRKLLKFVNDVPALRNQEYKLIVVAADPDFVKKTVKGYLQRFSFHDLNSVSKFYESVLSVSLFVDEANKREWTEIIQKRHDLVHRNGRNSDGVPLTTRAIEVQRVHRLVDELVHRVEDAFKAYSDDLWKPKGKGARRWGSAEF